MAEDNPERKTLFHLGFEGKPVKAGHDTNSGKFDIITSKSTNEQCVEGTHSFKLDLVCTDGDFFNLRFNLPEVIPITLETSLTGWIQNKNKRDDAAIWTKLLIKNPFPDQKDIVVNMICPVSKKKNSENDWTESHYPSEKFYNDVIASATKLLGEWDVIPAFAAFYLYCQPPVIEDIYIHVSNAKIRRHTVYVDNIEIRGVSGKISTALRYQARAEAMMDVLLSTIGKAKVKMMKCTTPGGAAQYVGRHGDLYDELTLLEKELVNTPTNLEEWMRLACDVANMEWQVNDLAKERL